MEPWLLALDLDGTACNDDGRLGQTTKRALAAARRAGHTVVFATGRRDVDMLPLGEDFRWADYLALNNGGKLVRTRDGAVLDNTLADPDAARALARRCLREGWILHVLSGLYWAVSRPDPGLDGYAEKLGVAPVLFHSPDQLPLDAIEGFMATADRAAIGRFLEQARLPLSYVESEPGCADILPRGITKWRGLTKLARLLNIPAERILAAGDYDNDLEMIRNAGIGVAVANALPEVKAAADYVTPQDNNHDAAAHIVEHFGFCSPSN